MKYLLLVLGLIGCSLQGQPTTTGHGVTVYVFDGGVGNHPEFEGRVRHGFNAFPQHAQPCSGHGTAVAGAIAGATLGEAREAQIVDVQVVNCDSLRSSMEALQRATRWVIEDHKLHPGPAIVNWSLIIDTARASFTANGLIALLRSHNMLVLVAAGNVDKDACKMSAGNAPGAFVVGSYKNSDRGFVRDEETAWGQCIDLFAPGVEVPLPTFDKEGVPIALLWSGTSFATAYSSGRAARLLEQFPFASPDELARLLRAEAKGGMLIR